jgi:hypothetical protein
MNRFFVLFEGATRMRNAQHFESAYLMEKKYKIKHGGIKNHGFYVKQRT